MSTECVIRILKAREERALRHKTLREIYPGTLLALTMNIPGHNKNTPIAQKAFNMGLESVRKLFSSRRVNILKHESRVTEDGPQACWIVDTPTSSLKKWVMEIEEIHPLGRLFDLDVQDTDGRTIHRESIGFETRRCLICEEAAHACARSRKHDLKELTQAVERLVNKYMEETDYA